MLFALLEVEDLFFNGIFRDEPVDEDRFLLSDAVCPVCGLSFYGGVPPGVQDDDVVGGGEVQSEAPGFECEQEEWCIGVGGEGMDSMLALFCGGLSGEHDVVPAVCFEECREEFQGFDEAGEDEHFVSFSDDVGQEDLELVEFGGGSLVGFIQEFGVDSGLS